MVEEGEYDRLRQRQYRDYSPEIRTMVKLQEQIVQTLMRTDLDPQQKLDLISGPQQRFNLLREETNTLTGVTAAKGVAGADAPKVEQAKATAKQEPVKDEAVPVKAEPIKVAMPQNADKLMDLISNSPNIIRRNDQNELEVNGKAVPGTNFDELYAAVLSPRGSKHMPGMTELFGALRQLKIEAKDIVSKPIRAAFESGVPRTGPLHHNEKAIPADPPKSKPKPKAPPKNKRRSTSPFEITEGPLEVKPATRSTTKYNLERKGLSSVTNKTQSGKGLKFPRILYVY